jgi:hypothetical protein
MLVGFGAYYGAAQSFPPLISFHRLPAAAGKFGGFGSTRAGRYAWQHRRGPIGPTRGRPWPPGGYLSLASEGSLVRRVCRAIVLRRRDAMRRGVSAGTDRRLSSDAAGQTYDCCASPGGGKSLESSASA